MKSPPTAKKKPNRRRSLPIELTAEAQEVVVSTRKQMGLPMTEVVERVLSWFAKQDDVIRASILGTIPESMRVEIAQIWMERQAKGEK